MEYNKIGLWAKGYIEALMTGDEVSKGQLETLIEKIREMIDEQEEPEDYQRPEGTDDLPF